MFIIKKHFEGPCLMLNFPQKPTSKETRRSYPQLRNNMSTDLSGDFTADAMRVLKPLALNTNISNAYMGNHSHRMMKSSPFLRLIFQVFVCFVGYWVYKTHIFFPQNLNPTTISLESRKFIFIARMYFYLFSYDQTICSNYCI